MMSKKQWFVLFCMYVAYLLMGASVFHEVESREELKGQIEDRKERIIIEDLLVKHYVPNEEHTQDEIFDRLTSYCGKPLSANMSEIDPPLEWDFYHSLFFVITVVTTIGYGNLAPTTTLTRLFMIFYSVIGIPMNGIVIITLGDYFSKSFIRLYDRWKTMRVQHALATLGLVGQIVLYLIPGFTFFIFIPSIIIMVYEGWAYDVALAYAFVTTTTIGFGDWVAGMEEKEHGPVLYMAYKIFLLVWIISGLGYIVMVVGFLTRGLRSKRIHNIEHKIASNLKKTNQKIREELRTVLNEYLLMRVKRVYREKVVHVPIKCRRSQSCPDLSIYRSEELPQPSRKRAFSTSVNRSPAEMSRIQSDSDLERIDKEKTFTPTSAMVEPGNLLLRVVNALGNYETLQSTSSCNSASTPRTEGIDLFPSNEILASEKYDSGWSLGSQKLSILPPNRMRPRAASECKNVPSPQRAINSSDLTWYGPAATKRLQELREQAKYGKTRARTLPPLAAAPPPPQSFFARLRNTIKSSKNEEKQKNIDIERQDYQTSVTNRRSSSYSDDQMRYDQSPQQRRKSSAFSIIDHERVLEETSIAEFLRALTAISVPESTTPKRKFGTASLTPPEESPPRTRRLAAPYMLTSRRTSLVPPSPSHESQHRRFSLRPEPTMTAVTGPPPPYYPLDATATNLPTRIITRNRKFSLRPVPLSAAPSPVQRHAMRFKQTLPLPPDPSFKTNTDKDSNA